MAMQTIKCGGFVAEEISKVNANFTEIQNDYAKTANVPTKTSDLTNDSNFVNQTQLTSAIAAVDIPTKTSDLTNDSGFTTTSAMNAALANKVDVVSGKGLSTNDYTTDEKNKLAGLSAPSKVSFTASNWSNGTYTTAANGKIPVIVMRKNGSNYESILADVQVIGTNVVITSDDAFEGYLILV